MTSSDESGGEAGSLLGESGASPLLPLDKADFELFPDRTDAASDLSPSRSPLTNPEVEFRGLSLLLPGIFDLNAPLNDRLDSLVSALLNDGYDWRLSSPLSNEVCDTLAFGVLAPEPLEFWFPIFSKLFVGEQV